MNTLSKILSSNQFRPEDVPKFEAKLFYEGERNRPYLERFFALLILASIIATAGVIGDSTATVIGAMIIAPLMTPIMATTAALTMGNIQRALPRLFLVIVGVATVIFISWAWGFLYSGVIDFNENSQILARISPRLIDLIAALASGAAGAFCLSRDDIADSLPGVAISISLVPPLCVVGLSLSAGEWDAAWGAFLLFITNFLAILLAGGAVLAILHLNQASMVEVKGKARRTAYTVVLVAILVVAIPLSLTGRQIALNARTEILSRQVAQEWLQDSEYNVRIVQSLSSNNVYIAIVGNGEPPLFGDLVAAIEERVGQPVQVYLEILPSQILTNAFSEP